MNFKCDILTRSGGARKKRKQHNALQHDGHTWHVSKEVKNGATIYYDCAQRGPSSCGVKLTAKKDENGGYTYKQNGASHTHILDPRDKEVNSIMNEAKKKAKTADKSSRALYAEALSGTPDEIAGQIPKANAFGKSMRNQRHANHPPAPKTLAELAPFGIGDVLTTTGNNFVLYDSASHQDDPEDRIIVFATKEGLEFLASCPQ